MSEARTNIAPTRSGWTAPTLVKRGTIADIAGNSGVGLQQGNNKS